MADREIDNDLRAAVRDYLRVLKGCEIIPMDVLEEEEAAAYLRLESVLGGRPPTDTTEAVLHGHVPYSLPSSSVSAASADARGAVTVAHGDKKHIRSVNLQMGHDRRAEARIKRMRTHQPWPPAPVYTAQCVGCDEWGDADRLSFCGLCVECKPKRRGREDCGREGCPRCGIPGGSSPDVKTRNGGGG